LKASIFIEDDDLMLTVLTISILLCEPVSCQKYADDYCFDEEASVDPARAFMAHS
jgi:hypothetical protein